MVILLCKAEQAHAEHSLHREGVKLWILLCT